MAHPAVRPLLALLILLVGSGCGGGGDEGGGACNGAPFPLPDVLDPESFSFEVSGTVATMTGVLDGSAPAKVQDLLDNFPDVTEIVMLDCPGSVEFGSTIAAARMVRDAGLYTRVPADGVIAGRAIDFFLGGVRRVGEPGSRILVNTWVTTDGALARDVPPTDCAHSLFLQHFQYMGLPDPSGFYFFSLLFGELPDGQPPRNLADEERAQYRVTTR